MSVAPDKATQSFVTVMSAVRRRPSLTALELAWRWFAGSLMLWSLSVLLGSYGVALRFTDTSLQATWQSISVFQPVAAIQTLHAVFASMAAPAWPLLHWLPFTVFLLWNLIAAFGRTLVLRRLDPALHPRRITIFVLGTLRSALLLGAWWLWLWLIASSARLAITAPAARNDEPSLVLFAAMAIAVTLALYAVWAIFSWFLQLAPLVAMQQDIGALAALRTALRSPARGQLIEINFVLHIVRIALLVLTMVFSATPLPFTSVATPEFLRWWGAAAVLGFLAGSDYFHVVRTAAYLSVSRDGNASRGAPVLHPNLSA